MNDAFPGGRLTCHKRYKVARHLSGGGLDERRSPLTTMLCAPDSNSSLCLFQTEQEPAHLHVAFVAQTREQVDAFHRAALEAGGKDNGAPGVRPHYHANYYAAFVLCPDGHNIEVV